jgi:hypothetical protein
MLCPIIHSKLEPGSAATTETDLSHQTHFHIFHIHRLDEKAADIPTPKATKGIIFFPHFPKEVAVPHY